MTDKKNRIFWLGMHVVLTKTELPRLRELGFEVFNPPYNSKVYDQSANRNWDADQPTSLPRSVFKELSEYNFFYNRISSRIATLLNEYFGTIIVTINPDWLEQILKVYNGRIIYRIYGQPYSISDAMWARRCFRSIQERDNFWIMPHCYETTVDEHDWLKERMRVVPYTLPLDVFDYRDTWAEQDHHISEIMVSCPNIDNAYYKTYYNRINQYFKQPYIRMYGIQPRSIPDQRVVGTIPRNDLLKAYQRSAGYLYLYEERNVCYLPPIEMMTVGGPVIYLPGSLLARFFSKNEPGLALDNFDAQRKLSWLIKGDKSFINDVIESQNSVRLRYAPEYVDPIFDSTFQELLLTNNHAPAHPIMIPFVQVRMPEEYEEGWHTPDIQSGLVWTKGTAIFPLYLFPKSYAYRLLLLNCAPFEITVTVSVGQQVTLNFDIPSGKEQEVIIKGRGDVRLSCQSWSPADIGLSSDNRHLGIAVRSIELLTEKD